MTDVTVSLDDLSVLLNIAALARARGHVSENDQAANDAIRRCREAVAPSAAASRPTP